MSYVEQLRRQKQLEHYQEDDPWGKEQADAIAEFGTNVMGSVVGGVTDWWKRSSADQEGWFDDALRLAAGGVKNVAAAAEDQEGYLDDALRLAGGGVKNTLNVIGAPGYISGQVGGAVIGALGGDRRLGEWGLGFAGDIVLGGYAAKGLKVARAGTQYARLSPFQRALKYGSTSGAMESAAKHTGEGLKAFKKGAKIAAKKEFAGEIALAGKIKDADTLMQVEGLKQAAQPGFYSGLPIPKFPPNAAKLSIKPQRTIDFKGLDQSKRRTAIAKYLDNIYTEGMTPAEKITFKHRADFGGYLTEKGQRQIKNVAGAQRELLKGSSHHFGVDLELAGLTLNRTDAPEIVKLLNQVDVYPGNHPNNYIMAYHDYTKTLVDAQKKRLIEITGKSQKEVDKFLKAIPEGKMLGYEDLSGLVDFDVMDKLQDLKEIKGKNWKAFTDGKLSAKDLDLPEVTIGTDHQDFIHGIGDKLPKRLELIKLSKSKKWLDLSPKEAAKKIAEVAREQQNVALNVNKWRLDKIKRVMLEEGISNPDWIDIQVWMIKNPRRAAHLDWHRTARLGIEKTPEQLTKDLPYKDALEVAEVFMLEKVPQTGEKLKLLSKTKDSLKIKRDSYLEQLRKRGS